jgi:hypothetical protein
MSDMRDIITIVEKIAKEKGINKSLVLKKVENLLQDELKETGISQNADVAIDPISGDIKTFMDGQEFINGIPVL